MIDTDVAVLAAAKARLDQAAEVIAGLSRWIGDALSGRVPVDSHEPDPDCSACLVSHHDGDGPCRRCKHCHAFVRPRFEGRPCPGRKKP